MKKLLVVLLLVGLFVFLYKKFGKKAVSETSEENLEVQTGPKKSTGETMYNNTTRPINSN